MRQVEQAAPPLAPVGALCETDKAWRRVWLRGMEIQVGVVPLPVFLLLLAV